MTNYTAKQDSAGVLVAPDEMPHWLLGMVIDDVFDGAIEDASVIEDIYRSIMSNLRLHALINSVESKP